MEICDKTSCTGCGACAYVCPQKCITMTDFAIEGVYPVVDSKRCINCNICKKKCPSLNNVGTHFPMHAYAAWNTDEIKRKESASGGIAAAMYELAMDNGYSVVGAQINGDFSVDLRMTKDRTMIEDFKNSKYVFSKPYQIYPEIRKCLLNNEKVLVVGLPCQISSIKSVFGDSSNILFVDLVCHGTTPTEYLQQHIYYLENKYENCCSVMFFRDPAFGTENHKLSLYGEKGDCFYSKRTADGDTYQYGYHRMISYRENCYHCIYAKSERVGDVPLSDYKGLGRLSACDFNEIKVSSVLVNTDKGKDFVDRLISTEKIEAYERPIKEPLEGDPQLRHPSTKSKARYDFEKMIYKFEGDFERTMNLVMRRQKLRNIITHLALLPYKLKRRLVTCIKIH